LIRSGASSMPTPFDFFEKTPLTTAFAHYERVETRIGKGCPT
jgi:hypothetical protein